MTEYETRPEAIEALLDTLARCLPLLTAPDATPMREYTIKTYCWPRTCAVE